MKDTRNIYDHTGFPGLLEAINSIGFPCKITIVSGSDRSLDQNRLMHMWAKETSEQLKEYTMDEYKSWCKLHGGVAIMREDPEFRAEYDRLIKPMAYEDKLKIMGEPLCFPVSRLMSTKQMTRYLDWIYTTFTGLGARLTMPPDKRYGPVGLHSEGN